MWNKCLFEDWKPSVQPLIYKIESLLNLFPVPHKSHKTRIIGLEPQKVFPCGFFDAAAAESLGGAGFVIYLNDNHYFSFSLGC